jgi:Glucodextranase, domain N
MKRMTAGAQAAGLALTVAAGLLAMAGPASGAATAPAADAPGGPGSMSFFDLGRKECAGTARNTTSKVWYTVAGGVLSDVYEPTVDNTNVGTLQYIVTDGSGFTDLRTRDLTYTVTAADPTGMSCTVTAASADHGYQLATTYLTDPASDTVLMQTRLSALPGSHTGISGLHLYARLDAHANGNGGQRQAGVLRLVPRGVFPRPVRGVHRPAHRR